MEPTWRDMDFLKPKDIMAILKCGNGTAYALAHRLPHVVIGPKKGIRVPTAAFEKWLKDEERKNAP